MIHTKTKLICFLLALSLLLSVNPFAVAYATVEDASEEKTTDKQIILSSLALFVIAGAYALYLRKSLSETGDSTRKSRLLTSTVS